jgi:hypothetical protein
MVQAPLEIADGGWVLFWQPLEMRQYLQPNQRFGQVVQVLAVADCLKRKKGQQGQDFQGMDKVVCSNGGCI